MKFLHYDRRYIWGSDKLSSNQPWKEAGTEKAEYCSGSDRTHSQSLRLGFVPLRRFKSTHALSAPQWRR
ncbi:hypothetical protein AGR4A_Cc180010 [Agrobacterium tumefaciens str. B6]|uniref:Uncharacterized protein n=1 Tax=Agrobacterium tumefaciens str. B6 TaxID=1183423 RepID=A0A822UY24_AGRTU|nr:hypothetical protein AGR4A_Cc180010 [Agrobacterium tumefaciens str. B6]